MDGQPVRFTPVAHGAVCPHHAVIVDTYNAEPIHVCTDPAAAGHQRFQRNPLRADEEEPGSQGDPEAEASWEAERQRQNQREEALIVAARVRRPFAQGLVRPSGIKAAELLLRLAVRDTLLSTLDDSDVDELRDLGEVLGVSIPEQIEEWEPVLEGFVQAIQSKRTVQDLIGVLFAVRLLDYEARGRNEHQRQTDDGFCRYVTLLIELGYEPSDIERELLAEWASDDQEAEANP